MIYTDPIQAAPAFSAALERAPRVLILSHVNPDGDAIGSTLAVYHALRARGHTAVPLAASAMPGYVMRLPGVEDVQLYQPGAALPESDLLFLVDTATPARVGRIYDEHGAELAARPLVIVDHHATNDGVNGVNLINPRAASTCELLYGLFRAMEIPITPAIATCLLLGTTTDTQSFQVSSTTPASLRVAADLLEAGADHRAIVHDVYYAVPASTAALVGQGLARLQTEDGIGWTQITLEMMRQTGAEDEAGDELVKMMQRIGGLRALALFKERRDGTTKVSLRSTPPYNVAALAQRWGGGGHVQAAGVTMNMAPAEAAAEILPLLKSLVRD